MYISTNEKKFIPSTNFNFTFTPGDYYFENLQFKSDDFFNLGNGNYRLTPAFYNITQDEYGNIMVPYGCVDHCDINVNKLSITFTTPDQEGSKIDIESISGNPSFYIGKYYKFNATISNSGSDFCDMVYPVIFNSDMQIVSLGNGLIYELRKGESLSQNLFGAIATDIEEGNYYFSLCYANENGYRLINNQYVYNIEIKNLTDETTITANDPVITNASNVDANNIEISSKITCSSGYFTDNVDCAIFDSNGNNVALTRSEVLFIESGNSEYAKFNMSIPNPNLNSQYIAAIFQYTDNGYIRISGLSYFTVTSGIDGVEADTKFSVFPTVADDVINITTPDEITRVEVYATSGKQVLNKSVSGDNSTTLSINNIVPGIYVVKIITTKGNYVSRIVKR